MFGRAGTQGESERAHIIQIGFVIHNKVSGETRVHGVSASVEWKVEELTHAYGTHQAFGSESTDGTSFYHSDVLAFGGFVPELLGGESHSRNYA